VWLKRQVQHAQASELGTGGQQLRTQHVTHGRLGTASASASASSTSTAATASCGATPVGGSGRLCSGASKKGLSDAGQARAAAVAVDVSERAAACKVAAVVAAAGPLWMLLLLLLLLRAGGLWRQAASLEQGCTW
jgi:hypothetical protein